METDVARRDLRKLLAAVEEMADGYLRAETCCATEYAQERPPEGVDPVAWALGAERNYLTRPEEREPFEAYQRLKQWAETES